MEYTNEVKYDVVPVDGYILQGPVSDRQGFGMGMKADERDKSISVAQEMIAAGNERGIMPKDSMPKGQDFLSLFPISAYRWNSLMSFG